MQSLIYEYLCQLNRNLDQAVEVLELIRKSRGIREKLFRHHRVEAEYLRSAATRDVLDVMNDVELRRSAELWKQKRAYEKNIGDPNDIYFELQQREQKRSKRGASSLIGVSRRFTGKPEGINHETRKRNATRQHVVRKARKK